MSNRQVSILLAHMTPTTLAAVVSDLAEEVEETGDFELLELLDLATAALVNLVGETEAAHMLR